MTLERLEERLGVLLGIGTTTSTVILAVGLAFWMAGVRATVASWLLTIGLVVLIATPIGRVLASAVGFAVQRDWSMLGMTLLVLASLAASLLVGF